MPGQLLKYCSSVEKNTAGWLAPEAGSFELLGVAFRDMCHRSRQPAASLLLALSWIIFSVSSFALRTSTLVCSPPSMLPWPCPALGESAWLLVMDSQRRGAKVPSLPGLIKLVDGRRYAYYRVRSYPHGATKAVGVGESFDTAKEVVTIRMLEEDDRPFFEPRSNSIEETPSSLPSTPREKCCARFEAIYGRLRCVPFHWRRR